MTFVYLGRHPKVNARVRSFDPAVARLWVDMNGWIDNEPWID